MLAVLIFLNSRGDVVLSRTFREGFSVRALAETFRNEVITTKKIDRCPINIIDSLCYVHLKLTDLYVVMVSNANMNCTLCIQYAIRLLQVVHAYFGALDESTFKENFVVLQNLVDESMDFGYPQLTDTAALAGFIEKEGFNVDVVKHPEDAEVATRKMMGNIPWRVEGLIYRVNEVFVDVFEDVNLLMTPSGEVLQSSVLGRIMVKNFLSGIPQCELVLNTRAYGEQPLISPTSEGSPTFTVTAADMQLSDVAFHPCVRLNAFNASQCLRFIPPDGEFTLMTYRSKVDVRPPLKVNAAKVREASKTRIEIEFSLKVDLDPSLTVVGIEVRVPCPHNTATAKVKVGKGKAKFKAVDHGVVWTIPSLSGGEEVMFVGEVKQLAPTVESGETLWSKPPISMSFQIISNSLTGLRVNELKVDEPMLMYNPNKWIRYTTEGGQYQCRI